MVFTRSTICISIIYWIIGGYAGDIALSDAEATSMIERYGRVAKRPIQQWIEHSETYDFNEYSTDKPHNEGFSKVNAVSETKVKNR